MKKVKKIKKGLECCASPVAMCNECPYGTRTSPCTKVKEDALVYIEELEERVAIMTEGQPEVVRCKDCWKRDFDNCPFYDTLDFKPDDEWFCADWEMKDNG